MLIMRCVFFNSSSEFFENLLWIVRYSMENFDKPTISTNCLYRYYEQQAEN